MFEIAYGMLYEITAYGTPDEKRKPIRIATPDDLAKYPQGQVDQPPSVVAPCVAPPGLVTKAYFKMAEFLHHAWFSLTKAYEAEPLYMAEFLSKSPVVEITRGSDGKFVANEVGDGQDTFDGRIFGPVEQWKTDFTRHKFDLLHVALAEPFYQIESLMAFNHLTDIAYEETFRLEDPRLMQVANTISGLHTKHNAVAEPSKPSKPKLSVTMDPPAATIGDVVYKLDIDQVEYLTKIVAANGKSVGLKNAMMSHPERIHKKLPPAIQDVIIVSNKGRAIDTSKVAV